MESGYWTKRSLTRRRLLKGASATGASIAALAAFSCGGDDDSSGKGSPEAGAQPGQGRRGGILTSMLTSDAGTLDLHKTISSVSYGPMNAVYSRLVKHKNGPNLKSADFELEGDLAASWEGSKDLQTWTFKLRPNAKWQNKAPLNGRAVTSEDVKASVERYMSQPAGNNKAQLSMLEKTETPDDKTVVFKLNIPYGVWPNALAEPYLLWILPKEADNGIDPSDPGQVVGSGPFILKSYTRGSEFTWDTNPEWHLGRANVDGLRQLVIGDLAASMAQFRTGNLHIRGLSNIELDDVTRSIPRVEVTEYLPVTQWVIYWSGHSKPEAMKDVRVRRAFSLALDRDGLLKFTTGGKGAWNTAVPAAFKKFWLDPKKPSEFGKGAEWQKFDVAQAKQLMSAAGYPDGFEYEHHVANYGQAVVQRAEAVAEMFKAVAKPKIVVDDVRSVFLVRTIYGDYDGINDAPVSPFTFLDANMFVHLHSSSRRAAPLIHNPTIDDLVTKQRTTTDEAQQKSAMAEIQRIVADQVYYIYYPAEMAWAGALPRVKNYYHSISSNSQVTDSYTLLSLES